MRAKKTRGKSWRIMRRYAPFITLTLSIMLLQSIMSAPDSAQSANEVPTNQAWQVEAGSDDCHVYGNSIALNTTYVMLTHVSSIAESGLRWTNVTIPRGATIESAYLEVQASGNYGSSTADLVIRGEDTDNASTFSTASDFIGRSRTNASVTWDLPTFVVGTWYTSPDITTIIQEIVGRQNWTSGNALALLCIATETGEYRTIYAHDYSSAYSAQLSITWSPPSTPPPPTIGFSPKDIIKQAKIGQNFTVNVTVTNANDLYAWQAGLTFNPGLLECVDIAEGEFLKGKAVRTLWTPGTIDNSTGIIHYHACALTGHVTGINGNGTLGVITFKVKNYGNSTLHLTDIILLDSTLTDTDNIPVDGSIFVTVIGDVDGDGDVDGFDLTYMCGCYGATPGHPRWDEDCDINGDGIIDGFDLTPACGNYGHGLETTALRGNLHTHTTWSDGANSPLEMVTHYRDLGYDFVAITDHDVWTEVSGLQDLGIIVFEGIEHSGGEHWNEIRGGGETLTIKNHPNLYGDTAEEIIAGPWDCHEATCLGTIHSYYTTIDHPYVYTDDAHSTSGAGQAWIVVEVMLTGNLDQDKALILQAIKAGNYVCQTG